MLPIKSVFTQHRSFVHQSYTSTLESRNKKRKSICSTRVPTKFARDNFFAPRSCFPLCLSLSSRATLYSSMTLNSPPPPPPPPPPCPRGKRSWFSKNVYTSGNVSLDLTFPRCWRPTRGELLLVAPSASVAVVHSTSSLPSARTFRFEDYWVFCRFQKKYALFTRSREREKGRGEQYIKGEGIVSTRDVCVYK